MRETFGSFAAVALLAAALGGCITREQDKIVATPAAPVVVASEPTNDTDGRWQLHGGSSRAPYDWVWVPR